MNLTRDQALHCVEVFHDYFDKFDRIDEYMRDQKLNALSELPIAYLVVVLKKICFQTSMFLL
jgi:hypothetical protein